jgi:putative effector of murein hydrolase LrgA (UPF0299 family)
MFNLSFPFSKRWRKYIQPIHLFKRYNGEAVAFYYMYVIHYITLLFVPALIGILLFINQMYYYKISGKMDLSLDSTWNGAFGIFVSIWASVFV